jgi:hypothetical protein
MDLTKQPPRRPTNLSMGGILNLARMTDKARAHNDETLGEYLYGKESGLDESLLAFLEISEENFADAAGRYGDAELVTWVQEAAGKTAQEIEAFNEEWLAKEPKAEDGKQRLKDRIAKYAPDRTDITTVLKSIELEDWGLFKDVDLTGRAPRSPFGRDVGGIYGVARMADKGRAAKAGLNGEFNYDCPIDQAILGFLGIGADDFQEAACANPNDTELGEWVLANTDRSRAEISTFNAGMAVRGPETDDQKEFFNGLLVSIAPHRTDVKTWFDLIDLDDEISFGTVDLTRHAARSPYDTSVCGMVGLSRMADKGWASIDGTLGDYWYGADSGADRMVLEALGLTPDQFTESLKTCRDDAALTKDLAGKTGKSEQEIAAFNEEACKSGPGDERMWGFYRNLIAQTDSARTDLDTWYALMLLDDRVSYARRTAGV